MLTTVKWAPFSMALLLGLLLPAAQANANPITFTEYSHNGSDLVDYSVSIGLSGSMLTVTVDVDVTSSIADIRGVFIDVTGSNPFGSLKLSDITSLSGGPVTQVSFDTTDAGKGANLNGGGFTTAPFDLALQIGSPGLKGGKDDFQTTTFGFLVSDLSLESINRVGVRGTSVGASREGSAKEISSAIVATVSNPLPASAWLGLSMFCGMGVVGAWRRKK